MIGVGSVVKCIVSTIASSGGAQKECGVVTGIQHSVLSQHTSHCANSRRVFVFLRLFQLQGFVCKV